MHLKIRNNKQNRKATYLVCLICAVLCFSSCIPLKPVYIKQIKSVSIDKVSFNEASLKVNLVIINPNPYKIILKDHNLEVYVNNSLLGKMDMDTAKTIIPKRSEKDYCISINADISNSLFSSLKGLLKGNEIPIEIKGGATIKALVFSKQIEIKKEDKVNIKNLF